MEEKIDKVQLACQKMVKMLEIKQESLGLKTRLELAEAIKYYCDEGVEITQDNLGGYMNPKRGTGKYVFPNIDKLKAIGLFLGYELDEFYEVLFNEGEKSLNKKAQKDLVSETWEKIRQLTTDDKINLHRFLSEDLYRELLF